jgi:flagellar protein FliO/FliZ
MFAAASTAALTGPATSARAAIPPVLQASPTFYGLVQVVFALALVLAAVFATAWVARRLSPGQMSRGGQLRIVAGVMVGAKERVVVVEVRDTWLVLGVTPSGISTLHTLTKPDDPPEGTNMTPAFSDRLTAILNARRSKHQVEGQS